MKLLLSILLTAIAVSSQAQSTISDVESGGLTTRCFFILTLFFILVAGAFFLGAANKRGRKNEGNGPDQNAQLR